MNYLQYIPLVILTFLIVVFLIGAISKIRDNLSTKKIVKLKEEIKEPLTKEAIQFKSKLISAIIEGENRIKANQLSEEDKIINVQYIIDQVPDLLTKAIIKNDNKFIICDSHLPGYDYERKNYIFQEIRPLLLIELKKLNIPVELVGNIDGFYIKVDGIKKNINFNKVRNLI